jgi:hypothetical protein
MARDILLIIFIYLLIILVALVLIDRYRIAVLSFMGLVLTVGILTSLLEKKSSKWYMVAGKSLPLVFVGTMLSAQSIDGNSSLGNVALVYEFMNLVFGQEQLFLLDWQLV